MAHRSPDLIPLQPLARILDEWLFRSTSDDPMSALGRIIWPDQSSQDGGSRLKKLFKQQVVTFDLADRILANLHLTHLWLEDPELREIYQSIDFTWLDYAHPTCAAVDRRNREVVRETHKRQGYMHLTAGELGLSRPLVRKLLWA